MAATRSTERAAHAPVAISGLPTRDPSRQLRPTTLRGTGGQSGILDQLIYGHTRIQTGVDDLRTAMAATDLALEPCAGELPDEELFRRRCEELITQELTADIDTGAGVGDVLWGLADAWVYGFSLCEATWYPDVTAYAGGGYRLELYRVHPSTVSNWTVRHGRIASVSQSTYGGSARIDAADLVHVTTEPSAGPEGVSQLRSFVFLYEQWKAAHLDTADRRAVEGGLLKMRAPRTADEASTRRLLDYGGRYLAGDSRILLLPDGYDAEIVTPSSIADSHVGFFEYIDAQADRLMGAVLQSLGYSAHGSRALGEAVAEREQWTRRDKLDRLLGAFGRRLLGMIADALGYTGRLPELRSRGEETASVSDRVDLLVRASPLTGWSDEDRDMLRSELGLAKRAEPASQLAHAGCTHHMSAQDWPMQTDASGKQVAFPRPFRGPEKLIAWFEVFDERNQIDVQFEGEVERIRADQEQAVFAALRDGVITRAERRRILDEYGDRYLALIEAYLQTIRQAVTRQTATEAQRAVATGQVVRGVTPELDVLDGYQEQRAATERAESERIADVMASRVLSEIESRVSASGAATAAQRVAEVAEDFTSRITVGGITEEARGLGNRVESGARVETARDGVAGVVPVRLYRSSVWDRSRCGHCESLDGYEVDLTMPEIGPDQIPTLPDPDCDGGAGRCRCGWIIVWGER